MADQVKLVVTASTNATFYYFDDEPFKGTLERKKSLDKDYAVTGYDAQAYHLTGSYGSYWEFALIIPRDGSDPLIYLEVGPDGNTDSLYLSNTADKGQNTPPNSTSSIVGTWKLDAAYDADGEEYDVAGMADQVKLVATSATSATLYYFDDEPFKGALERQKSLDKDYAVTGYDAMAYYLTGSDGSYWEFALIIPQGDPSEAFVYLEVGPEGNTDSLYLARY